MNNGKMTPDAKEVIDPNIIKNQSNFVANVNRAIIDDGLIEIYSFYSFFLSIKGC